MKLPAERPTWLRQNVLRAVSEGSMSTREGEQILGESMDTKPSLSLVERRALMAMSVEERRRHLKDQADRIAAEYEPESDWQEIEGEDFAEY